MNPPFRALGASRCNRVDDQHSRICRGYKISHQHQQNHNRHRHQSGQSWEQHEFNHLKQPAGLIRAGDLGPAPPFKDKLITLPPANETHTNYMIDGTINAPKTYSWTLHPLEIRAKKVLKKAQTQSTMHNKRSSSHLANQQAHCPKSQPQCHQRIKQ